MSTSYVVNRSEIEISRVKDGLVGRDVIVLQNREHMVSGVTVVHPQSQTRGHAHPKREEHYYVLSGEGYIQLGEERYPIRAGDGIHVPPISLHTVINPNHEPLEFFWAAFPDEPKLTPDGIDKE